MRLAVALGVCLVAATAQARVVTKDVAYQEGGISFVGHVAYDDAKTSAPGVLIVPQWMGLTDYEKGRARQLAELGYVAFCADIYGSGLVAKDANEAGALAGKFKKDRATFRTRLGVALRELRNVQGVDATRVAAIGYCFGGTGVLELARSGADLLGVVSFHGGLDSPAPADGRNIKAKVLVLHGADDPFTPKDEIAAMEKELRDAKVDYQLVYYSGAVHAFTQPMAGNDPSRGAAYDAKADRRSWIAMRAFFAEIFAQ